jgi:lysophospholipase L1-like esterase
LGSIYDRVFRSLHDRPDVTMSRPTTIQTISPILELTQTFVVQTARAKDDERGGRDTIFVQYVGNDGSFRVALPPEVADVIARQRGSVTSKNRKTAARQEAARRKAAGIVPGFLNGKKRKAKKGE